MHEGDNDDCLQQSPRRRPPLTTINAGTLHRKGRPLLAIHAVQITVDMTKDRTNNYSYRQHTRFRECFRKRK